MDSIRVMSFIIKFMSMRMILRLIADGLDIDKIPDVQFLILPTQSFVLIKVGLVGSMGILQIHGGMGFSQVFLIQLSHPCLQQ